jgi:hypothetical protein
MKNLFLALSVLCLSTAALAQKKADDVAEHASKKRKHQPTHH